MNQEIGWSVEAKLLQLILKELDKLAGGVAKAAAAAAPKPPETVPGNSYTINSGDVANIVTTTSSSPVNITVPTGLTANQDYEVQQLGTGKITFVPAPGVTFRMQSYELPSTAEQYARVAIVYMGPNEYQLIGQLSMI